MWGFSPRLVSRSGPMLWFCSSKCQQIGDRVIDKTANEVMAHHYGLTMAVEVVEEIGWDKKFSDLSEQQISDLLEAYYDARNDRLQGLAEKTATEPVPF